MEFSSFKPMWPQLRAWWARRSGLATFTMYLLAVEAVLLLVRAAERLEDPQAAGPRGWIYLIGVGVFMCLAALGFRWFRRVLMWRLRNRLLVTYGFIGVIPVALLLAIGVIAAYLFAGQFATFVISSDINSELKSLESANRQIAAAIAAQVARGTAVERALPELREMGSERSLTVRVQTPQGKPRVFSQPEHSEVALPPELLGLESRAVIADKGGLRLRAWTSLPAGRDRLTVISTIPLDQTHLERIAADLGEIAVYAPDFQSGAKSKPGEGKGPGKTEAGKGSQSIVLSGGNVLVQSPGSNELLPTLPPVAAGAPAPPKNRFDREVLFGMPLKVVDWNTGKSSSALVRVRTRPSLLYGRLFVALGEFADLILIVLAAVAIVFGLIELVALITGIRLTRTMTRSVAALYDATEHINRRDLSYRIKVTSRDQLAALEESFNSMTGSLEKLIAEQKEKQRMESELAIAQEVQAQLFPRETEQLRTLEVHGVCRPARTVSGDYYDFLPVGPERLGIAVGDISGKGISAALLMATIHSAVRVYEFGHMPARRELVAAGLAGSPAPSTITAHDGDAIQSPASVLSLLNRHLFHSTPPEKYATLFFGLWDGASRTLTYSNGGHLPPLVIGRDSSVRRLEVGGMVVGLLDELQFEEETIALAPGDLFVAFSDGITEPENDFGEFGEQRLVALVKENRHESLPRLAENVIAAVNDWIGGAEQPDDVTLVLARAK